jgi:hypothetical protein
MKGHSWNVGKAEARQEMIDDALTNLTKEQVVRLLDDERYRGWIKTELAEREAHKKIREEEQ